MRLITSAAFLRAAGTVLTLFVVRPCNAQLEGDLVEKTGPRPASLGAMLGSKLSAKEGAAKLDDAVIDLEAGRVVAWLLSRGDHQVVAPREALHSPPSGLPSGSPPALTEAAHSVFSRFPPAHEQIDRLHVLEAKRLMDADRVEEVDVDVDRPLGPLVRYSSCVDREVLDRDGQRVGSIVDFAVRRDGVVQYVVVRKGKEVSGELLAIPLGAFVLNDENQVWRIELPGDLIVKRGPIEESPSSWPADVGHGWEEFVRIKYGRALRGVRHLSASDE